MKWRLAVVLGIVICRLLINFIATGLIPLESKREILFNQYEIVRNGSECIIRTGLFWYSDGGWCEGLDRENLVIIGRLESSLIDRVVGRVWVRGSVHLTEMDDQGIPVVAKGWFEKMMVNLRANLASRITERLPEPEAGLVLGVVMGFKSSLGKEFYDKLVESGTVHMVVASGYNVMLVASLCVALFLVFFKRRMAIYLSILVMFFYAWLTGLEISVIRASLMGGLLLLSTTLGRSSRPWWTLGFTAAVMVLIEPILVFDISFQLSVAATFGVIVVAPMVEKFIDERGMYLSKLVSRVELVPTLSAIVLTAPLIYYHFGRGSLISPVSNLIILPLIPVLMAFGGVMLGVSLLLPGLTGLIALPTYGLAHLVVILVNFFGGVY